MTGAIKGVLMSGVFQFVPFDIRAANPKCAVAYLFPDKVPAECSDFAAELFRFVQGIRDSD